MGSDEVYVAPHGYGAVAVDEVVVADVAPAALFVPPAHIVHGVVATLLGVGAMDDDFVDMPARAFQSGGYQQGEGGGAYDAVNGQPVGCLEILYGLGRQWTEDAVGLQVECPLYLCDHLAATALFVRHHSSLYGSMLCWNPSPFDFRCLGFCSMTVSPVSMC